MKLRLVLKVVVIFFVVVIILSLIAIYLIAQSTPSNDIMLSCNAHALDVLKAEEARKDKIFDYEESNAIRNIENDKCMKDRGFQFTGGSDFQFCNTSRISDCYSRE